MSKNWYRSGDWNAICDVCGRKFKASKLKKRWDGYMVCHEDWEIRHPQELIRPIKDLQKLPFTRPRGTDQFISVNQTSSPVCTAAGLLSISGMAIAGCAISGRH